MDFMKLSDVDKCRAIKEVIKGNAKITHSMVYPFFTKMSVKVEQEKREAK